MRQGLKQAVIKVWTLYNGNFRNEDFPNASPRAKRMFDCKARYREPGVVGFTDRAGIMSNELFVTSCLLDDVDFTVQLGCRVPPCPLVNFLQHITYDNTRS